MITMEGLGDREITPGGVSSIRSNDSSFSRANSSLIIGKAAHATESEAGMMT